MDTPQDNPLKRFGAYWLGLILFGAFGLTCMLINLFSSDERTSAEQERAKARLAVRQEIDAAQKAELIEIDLSTAAQSLIENKPAASSMKDPSAQ